MIAGWGQGSYSSQPIRDGLRAMAIAKFGEGKPSKFDMSPVNDNKASYILRQLTGAIPFGHHRSFNGLGNGCARVFLRMCLINALYNYLVFDKDPQEIILIYMRLDKFYYTNTLLLN